MSWEKHTRTDGSISGGTPAAIPITLNNTETVIGLSADSTIVNNTLSPINPWMGLRIRCIFQNVPAVATATIRIYSSANAGATYVLIWQTGELWFIARNIYAIQGFRPYAYNAMSGTVVFPPNGAMVPAKGTATLRFQIRAIVDDGSAVGNPLPPGVTCNGTVSAEYSNVTS